MKKVTVITQAKDADSAVMKLRALGVVHVDHQQPPAGSQINEIKESAHIVGEALNILSETKFLETKRVEICRDPAVWQSMTRHIVELRKRLDHLEEYSRKLNNDIREWEEWGDFDPLTISSLKSKSVYVRLYRVPSKELKNFPPSAVVKSLSAHKGLVNCVVISQGEIEVPFKEVVPPKMSLADMRARSAENSNIIKSIRTQIQQHICYRESFLCIKKELLKELELHEAIRGMARTGSLSYLSGYLPFDKTAILSEEAKAEKWGIVINDPSPEDMPPTLIRNPRWVSVIAPVFKIIEIVPGYHELDISLWFLLFFSVFFGMLIGDAGYGIIFFILTFLAQKKWGRAFKEKAIFHLFYILSTSAILWGALTGTFFGQEWLSGRFKPLIPALRSDKGVQTLCFFLGVLHLNIAHIWRAILKAPNVRALADVGWTIILWGGFFLARTLILGDAFPGFGKWLFIIGSLLVILFTAPAKNVLKGIGTGLGALLLSIVNSFTDIVSYIRLFAVGLAGVAIADAFNAMAMSLGFNSILSSLMTAAILLIGHSLNIVLGPLAVIVHGVRLNVLEFCSHVDIKWSGFLYHPLREEKADAG